MLAALALLTTAAAADPCTEGKPFDEAALRARLTALASPELDGRAPGTAGDLAARALITERFTCLGLTPGADDGTYAQAFDAEGQPTANLVGLVAGETDELVVVGAHHDHVGDKHLGANDNASGVVALLAIAQAVVQQPKPKRTIVFVTFGGEELGLLGSSHLVAHPPRRVDLAKVVAFVNLDMVGSYSSTRAVYAFGSFPTTAAGKLLDRLDDAYPKLRVGLGGHSVRGDQVPFCKAKIPYVFFWTPDARCYHETCDTVGKIDFPHLAMIASLARDLVRGLADSKLDLGAMRGKTGCGK
ncbi:MAG: M20/M25/M40 family metallo-hydrolase [Proteobacteria bacterium]|nr:M20/M25/M40 family metallo-hydrolase [Pseudomonadota bacterium]